MKFIKILLVLSYFLTSTVFAYMETIYLGEGDAANEEYACRNAMENSVNKGFTYCKENFIGTRPKGAKIGAGSKKLRKIKFLDRNCVFKRLPDKRYEATMRSQNDCY
jgi:hypothetical protein